MFTAVLHRVPRHRSSIVALTLMTAVRLLRLNGQWGRPVAPCRGPPRCMMGYRMSEIRVRKDGCGCGSSTRISDWIKGNNVETSPNEFTSYCDCPPSSASSSSGVEAQRLLSTSLFVERIPRPGECSLSFASFPFVTVLAGSGHANLARTKREYSLASRCSFCLRSTHGVNGTDSCAIASKMVTTWLARCNRIRLYIASQAVLAIGASLANDVKPVSSRSGMSTSRGFSAAEIGPPGSSSNGIFQNGTLPSRKGGIYRAGEWNG
ncbi:hypothetical protein K488DRAFT_73360 [Vararia minispora EC-137]|uniref:Uncharacterized protein n=1 Tax=Vararia minispora EC-137 TaxID=1314806 RepID=A0ACB8QBF5_9AGAM|nr:hypothetical protein K488DRAFT_73360 [Vararia minispora EC-137]